MASHTKETNSFKPLRNQGLSLLFLGLFALFFALIGETLIDIAFEGESFITALLFPNPHELAIRLHFIGTLILFSLYIATIWRKRDFLESSLQGALEAARLERGKSEAILEVVGDGISIQDLDLKIIYQNRAHLELVGNHLGEACYRAYQERDVPCKDCHLLLSLTDGTPHRREATTLVQGRNLHVEIISTPLRDSTGKIVAGIESLRDITRRKEIEQNILNLNAALRKKTHELDVLNQDLKAFSYSLSHDLKTPLTIIYGSAQVLHDTYATRLDETGNYLLEQIIMAGERMDQLLDAMMQMAHHAQIELQREEIDLSAMAKDILARQRLSDPTRIITATISDGVIRNGDPRLIRSVMENLLGNAWKYTRNQKSPHIEFGCQLHQGVDRCYVRDNGVGFDMEKVEKLFRPFQRLHSQEEFEGNGVGLATAQQIVHRHNGRIWAEGAPGRGATFFFTL